MLDQSAPPSVTARQAWLGILARAPGRQILEYLADAPDLPDYVVLRGPEVGMAMLRGQMGGGGDAFNFGEVTLVRCSIQDAEGRIGHGYARGRDEVQAVLMARLDAALQAPALHPVYDAAVVQPLAALQAEARAAIEAKAAATEVKFFTLAAMRS